MLSMLSSWWAGSYFPLFCLTMAIQWVGWAVAVVTNTEIFYDLTGSLTFITVSYLSHAWSPLQSPRQFLQSHLVMLWALRLGTFLFIRILRAGLDPRFNKAKKSPMVFLKFWTLQGVWVYITILPTLILNNSTRNPDLGAREFIGWMVWLTGMSFEVLADFQKSMFNYNPENKGKFIRSGLWSLSRHPNYFGEIVLWFGLYISASSVFRGLEFLSVLSPVFIFLLITRLSGIPLLEKAGVKKWGHLPEYRQYLRQTPELWPRLSNLVRSHSSEHEE